MSAFTVKVDKMLSAMDFSEEDLEALEIRGGIKADYCPIDIDDRLNERYRILHLLGHGVWSKVWLAIDEETRKYVAIKVGIAQSDGSEGDILTEISQSLASSNVSNDKKLMIPTVLDRFEVRGPKGTHPCTHPCLVTLPARCTLEDALYKERRRLLPLDLARSLAAQLAIAVSIVHEKGYAHGDLHLNNFLLQLPSSLDDLSVEKLYETYGEPKKRLLEYPEDMTASKIRDLSLPKYLVTSVCLSVPGREINLAEAKLTLSDFGAAFRPADKSRFISYGDLALRPPEALFEPEKPLDFASDIWSLGFLIFRLLAVRSLIDEVRGCALPGQVTAQHFELSGHMPTAWWRRWEERPEWYTEDGEPVEDEPWSWERRFEEWVQKPRQTREMEKLAEDELAAVLKLLRSMLAWKPSERPNISKVLESDWMTRWALPAYQDSERFGEAETLERTERLGGTE
ncbi:hypothetical protein E4U12_006172 [Claviceps purpurea]|nr:hypothetical protein E4U12_006172 [Claviceps purpurea]